MNGFLLLYYGLTTMSLSVQAQLKRFGNPTDFGAPWNQASQGSVLMHDYALSSGRMTSVEFYITNNRRPIYFQLWFLAPGTDAYYMLLYEQEFVPQTLGKVEMHLDRDILLLGGGEKFGFRHSGDTGAIGFTVNSDENAEHKLYVSNEQARIGQSVNFHEWNDMIKFSMAVTINNSVPVTLNDWIGHGIYSYETGANTGESGEVGPRGELGPAGEPGSTGPPGSDGQRGFAGRLGVKGLSGEQGYAGEEGIIGDPGRNGSIGNRGPKGFEGVKGSDGASGPRGPEGVRGMRGLRGEQGDQGWAGPRGFPGFAQKGDRGEVGQHGATSTQRGEKGDYGGWLGDFNQCSVNNGGCQHVCRKFYGGFLCECFSGYDLMPDRRNCEDRNECAMKNGGCQHICKNIHKSPHTNGYYCLCENGYRLADDHHTCIDTALCPQRQTEKDFIASVSFGGCSAGSVCINSGGKGTCELLDKSQLLVTSQRPPTIQTRLVEKTKNFLDKIWRQRSIMIIFLIWIIVMTICAILILVLVGSKLQSVRDTNRALQLQYAVDGASGDMGSNYTFIDVTIPQLKEVDDPL